MTTAFSNSSIFGLVMQSRTGQVADPAFHEGFLGRDIAFAKAAYDSGNELAALDARCLCAGIVPIPSWATDPAIDLNSARHRRVKKGPNIKALQFTLNQMDHLERYAALVVAMYRDRVAYKDDPEDKAEAIRLAVREVNSYRSPGMKVGDEERALVRRLTKHIRPRADGKPINYALVRAVELLADTKHYGTETIRQSYMRVERDVKAGCGIDYWYPQSAELAELMRWREGRLLSSMIPVQNGNTWSFVYLRE